jgi:hypothetical protein
MSNHIRLLPRPNQAENINETSPVIRERTPTPEKCRYEYYQKTEELLSYNEIKGKICQLYFRPESKAEYIKEMMLISTKRKFGEKTKYPNEKYCDVIKKDPKFIAGLLQKDFVKPESLRDYCFLTTNKRYFK